MPPAGKRTKAKKSTAKPRGGAAEMKRYRIIMRPPPGTPQQWEDEYVAANGMIRRRTREYLRDIVLAAPDEDTARNRALKQAADLADVHDEPAYVVESIEEG